MKDVFDIIADVRELVNVPAVQEMLGAGKVWTLEKPAGSPHTDVVIRSNGGTNDADQVCFVEINCHAPSITSTQHGKPQQLANQPLLAALAKAIPPLVDGIFKPSFRCWLEEVPVALKEPDGKWFINITVRYQSIQTNYKNI